MEEWSRRRVHEVPLLVLETLNKVITHSDPFLGLGLVLFFVFFGLKGINLKQFRSGYWVKPVDL